MSGARFDLVEEPWVPCVDACGAAASFGLRETLIRAHELREVRDASPLVTAALYRLLLCLVHRIVDGPASLAAWRRIYADGRLDSGAIAAYLDRWRDRFDLFSSRAPFFQDATLTIGGATPGPVSQICLDRASGNEAVFFEHSLDAECAPIPPGRAALELLSFQAFAHGGRIQNEAAAAAAAPLRAGAVAIVCGASVFETLLLNLLVYDPAHGSPIPADPGDAPHWERPDGLERRVRPARGWLDRLSWRGRRVLFIPEDGVVRRVIVAAGEELAADDVREPMFAFRETERGFEPVRFRLDRTPWRDGHTLLHTTVATGNAPATEAPQAVRQLASLARSGAVPPGALVRVDVCGAVTSRAKVSAWRAERYPVPAALVADSIALHALGTAIETAERACAALDAATWDLASLLLYPPRDLPGGRSKRIAKEPIRELQNSLGAAADFWDRMGAAFPRLLTDLPSSADAALEDWTADAVLYATNALAHVHRRLHGGARELRALAAAEVRLRDGLRRLTRPLSDEEAA